MYKQFLVMKIKEKKKKKSSEKIDVFNIFAQNIDEMVLMNTHYPQYMFWIKKIRKNVYLCIPQFNYVKVGFTFIMKTCPCNVYPLEPHFYIAKLGYAGVYLFFLFLLQNIDCGYSTRRF